MSIEDEDKVIDETLRKIEYSGHVKNEIEAQVKCLKEMLARLEKFLPQNNSSKENATNEKTEIQNDQNCCSIDQIPKKTMISDIECTAKTCDGKIVETNEQLLSSNASVRLTDEKLNHLETLSQELYSCSENLEKNQKYLEREAENLSRILDSSREYFSDRGKNEKRECTRKFMSQNIYSVCSSNKWRDDMKTKYNKCKLKKSKNCCSCYETYSSSSDSEGPCDCLKIEKKLLSVERSCECGNIDDESEYSSSSSDDRTIGSDKSRYTCFCSINHSHDEFESETEVCYHKDHLADTNIERFRGGLDILHPRTTIVDVCKSEKYPSNFTSLQSIIVDHLKYVRVEELREGLERLKFRNRNLRDFLNNLDNSSNLMNKSSESNSFCTQISSYYSLDLAKQTRSELLTIVKILKNKCRNKDATILALTDELRSEDSKQSQIIEDKNHITHQPAEEKPNFWKTFDPEKDVGRKFTKKDSAIGFLIFLMILVSHVKRSEMISYLSTMKKIFTESSFDLVLFINESEKFSLDFMISLHKKIELFTKKFLNNTIIRWKDIISSIGQSIEPQFIKFRSYKDYIYSFLVEHQIYAFYLSIIPAVILIVKLRKSLKNSEKISENIQSEKLEKLKYTFTRSSTLFNRQIFVSRIFWLLLGIFSHIIWNNCDTQIHTILNYLNVGYLNSTEIIEQNSGMMVENSYCDLIGDYNYSWLLSLFCTKLQNIIELIYDIIKNV